MHILLSNDDGYLAPGIRALWNYLQARQDVTVTMVAPDRNQSGTSSSLTLSNPLRLTAHNNEVYSVNGTPTDCVHLGLTGVCKQEPDIVLSGINEGANMGDDVIYSGTVAAALEGRFLGLPAIAVSLASLHGKPVEHYDTAVKAVEELLKKIKQYPDNGKMILNVNVPDVPWSSIRGFWVTRLGQRHRSEPVIEDRDPRGRPIYWVGPPGEEADAGEGTDFYAVRQGFVSVTPIRTDLTYYQVLNDTVAWLQS